MPVVITPPTKIELRIVEGKGMGVFASQFIAKGETIEIAPVRPFGEKETKVLDEHGTTIPQYYFIWDEEEASQCSAVVFGYGSLYNHSASPNIDLEKDYTDKVIKFYALKDIEPGTELTYDYEVEALWFKPV